MPNRRGGTVEDRTTEHLLLRPGLIVPGVLVALVVIIELAKLGA